jgi:hypothetical protein
MLCGISVVFNSFDEFGLMRWKRSSENRQVLIGFQSTKAFSRLQYAGGGPAQCHRGRRKTKDGKKAMTRLNSMTSSDVAFVETITSWWRVEKLRIG